MDFLLKGEDSEANFISRAVGTNVAFKTMYSASVGGTMI